MVPIRLVPPVCHVLYMLGKVPEPGEMMVE